MDSGVLIHSSDGLRVRITAPCPAMNPRAGYIVCGETVPGDTCVVQCSAGFTGTPTTYLCDGSQTPATFVAQSAEGTCILIRYVLRSR
jgi:hypothetical protein